VTLTMDGPLCKPAIFVVGAASWDHFMRVC
jgi:hypothetical protein